LKVFAHMTSSQQVDVFHRLVRKIDPTFELLKTWPLAGGVSAEITGIEVRRPDGQVTKLLVRRHGEVDRAQNPNIARDEFKLLRIAQAHGLAAPKAYYVNESCDLFSTPVLVIEYVEGNTEFVSADLGRYLGQMAAELVRIHGVHDSPELSFLPRQDKGFGERPETLDISLSEDRIREALESAWPLDRVNAPVLLHGDYWPGNILWHEGKLAAVIDWEDARVGDPLADLASCRLELLWAFGEDAMNMFTTAYQSLTAIDVSNLPYWDLCAALRPCGNLASWGLDAETEQRMRLRHTSFVDKAVEALVDHS